MQKRYLQKLPDAVAREMDLMGPATPLCVKLKSIASPCHLADQDQSDIHSCADTQSLKYCTGVVNLHIKLKNSC